MFAAYAFLLFALQSCNDSIRPAAAALQQNERDKADAILNAARKACSGSAWFYELTGVKNDLAGDSSAAEEAFRKAVELSPGTARLHVDLGTTYLRSGKRLEARTSLERAVVLGASDSRLLFTLGTLEAQLAGFRKAVEYLRRIPAADADGSVYFNLGLAYSHLRQVQDAREAYFKVIDQQPDNTEAYFRVGLDYSATGDKRKAIAWLFRANELTADRVDIVYALTEELIGLKYLKTAAELVNKALLKNPHESLLIVASGDLEQQKGNNELALSKYTEAVAEQPQFVAGIVGLAQVALAQGNDQVAREYLLKGLAVEPGHPGANAALGLVESHQREWTAAQMHLQRAWDLDPYNMTTGLELARVLRSLGKPGAALQLLKRIEPWLTDSPSFHVELGRVYSQLHRTAEAQSERNTVSAIEMRLHEGLRFEDVQTYVH